MGSIAAAEIVLEGVIKRARRNSPVFLCLVGVVLSACMLDWETKPIEGTETDSTSEQATDGSSDTGVEDSESFTDGNTDLATDTMHDTATTLDTDDLPCPDLTFTTSVVFTETAASDNDGGVELVDSCPGGQVIVGFRGFIKEGYADGIIGKLQPLCGATSVQAIEGGCAVAIGAGETLPLRGDAGDIEWTRMCPENAMIVGFRAQTGADVDFLTFLCAPLLITRGESEWRVSRGTTTELEKAGGAGGATKVETLCSGDMVATGVQVRSEGSAPLRAISLGCQGPSLE